MAFVLYRATLALATPLGTPLAGDTLFGQCCWALREAKGEAELTRRLEGYTRDEPWLIVSDGFPDGHLPKPTLPQYFEPPRDPKARKDAKRKRWIPAIHANATLPVLLASAVDDAAAYGKAPLTSVQAHNTINRLTGTTGAGAFAPYTTSHMSHAPGQRINVYLVIDEERLPSAEAGQLLIAIGAAGFGRDANIGLGKFSLEDIQASSITAPAIANAFWTLAPCAPQGQGFDRERSYWRALTRFGRHGNAHALAGNPFKTPVLMATTGAVFTPAGEYAPRPFIGQGLGSNGRLSKTEPATVHQGYAPALPIYLDSRPG